MTARTEIFTDGSCHAGTGGWAAAIIRTSSGKQAATSSYAMELRALVEAVKMAEGPCTVVSDYEGMVRAAQEGKTPEKCKAVWQELYAAMAGKDVEFAWKKRGQDFGQRIAHQLAREAARAA